MLINLSWSWSNDPTWSYRMLLCLGLVLWKLYPHTCHSPGNLSQLWCYWLAQGMNLLQKAAIASCLIFQLNIAALISPYHCDYSYHFSYHICVISQMIFPKISVAFLLDICTFFHNWLSDTVLYTCYLKMREWIASESILHLQYIVLGILISWFLSVYRENSRLHELHKLKVMFASPTLMFMVYLYW